MSDFDATPVDEQASDLLDDNATADNGARAGDRGARAGDNPAVAERLRQFASQKAAIVDVEPPAPAVRERLVAAALAAAPASNVVSLRRRPILAAGAGLVAAAAAASLIFVVSNRHNETKTASEATIASAVTAAAASPQTKAADSAATEAATGAFAATTAAAAGTTAVPAPATMFASALADRSYKTPQELVAAYQAARESSPPPSPATSVSPTCAFAGERIGSITYQDTPAELFVTTDSFGHAHLTALAIEDCHRVIEVTVP